MEGPGRVALWDLYSTCFVSLGHTVDARIARRLGQSYSSINVVGYVDTHIFLMGLFSQCHCINLESSSRKRRDNYTMNHATWNRWRR